MTDETETPKPSPIIDLPGGDAILASEIRGIRFADLRGPAVVLMLATPRGADFRNTQAFRFEGRDEAFAERDRIITAWKAATS